LLPSAVRAIVVASEGASMVGKWRLAGAVAALSMMGFSAAAAGKVAPSEANWASRPTTEEYGEAYGKVLKEGVFFRAVVHCAVEENGDLSGCRVVRDTPAGGGFGAALLSLAPKYRRKPPRQNDPREVYIADGWFSYDKAADWLKRPTPEDLLAVFPTAAYKRGQSGKAIINCIVTQQGALTDCVTLEETPAGAGFGSAAIALTPQFLMRPATWKGAPIASSANIPITFVAQGAGETFGSKKVVTAAIMWSEAPSYADVVEAYPTKARGERKGGRATLACSMTEAGRLTHCDVAMSNPEGYGFDVAAKALAKGFSFPVRNDGDRKATHSIEVHVPFTFDPAMLDEGTHVVGKPSWAALPTREQVQSAFKDVKVTGTARAMLGCAIQPGGSLDGCKVTSETPSGLGVGAAALALAPTFRLTTWTAEGLPVVGGVINIPIRYEGDPAPM